MNDRPILISAAAVAPMDRPIIRDAGVFCAAGRIIAVGPISEIRRSLPPHEELHLGHALLLPGLINAHVHLELSGCDSSDSPGGNSFGDWIRSLPQRTGRLTPEYPQRVAAAVEVGVQQCLRYGVTAVGDISAQPDITRPLLRHGPLRVVSFGEALGLAKARDRFDKSLTSAIDGEMASDHLRIGLSPHAPYTVDLQGYDECVRLAKQKQIPLATHLAETPDEETFLRSQQGLFRDLWNSLGTWADDVQTFDGPPIAFARAIGLLDVPTILAHVNYAADDHLSMLAAGQASVVYCPRTHAYFDHKPHRWREMLARGTNVAIGTDSCASSPNLNLVDDLRLLWRRHGHAVDSELLWSLVTINAARALQWDGRIGSITPGKLADFTAFSFVGDVDPLAAVLEDDSTLPLATWIAGRKVG